MNIQEACLEAAADFRERANEDVSGGANPDGVAWLREVADRLERAAEIVAEANQL